MILRDRRVKELLAEYQICMNFPGISDIRKLLWAESLPGYFGITTKAEILKFASYKSLLSNYKDLSV